MSKADSDDWERQSADPDLQGDLNYELVDWISVSATQNGDDYLMFIPEEEEMIHDDEFIVVHDDDVVELIENV